MVRKTSITEAIRSMNCYSNIDPHQYNLFLKIVTEIFSQAVAE